VTDRLRVVTLNTWGVRGDWPARRTLLADGFARLDADFLLLQETILRPDLDQVREVLGDGYHLAHSRSREEEDGQGTTIASRWPISNVIELDLHVTDRTHEFACSAVIAEVDVPGPAGRVWVVNHFPDYQVDHETERLLQTLLVAREVESAAQRPDHVVLGGDLDAEPDADTMRFLTGRYVADGLSVCYHDAWAATHPGAPGLDTYVPENPHRADDWWPFRQIDHILVRSGADGGPTLRIVDCARTFDQPDTTASDHYGVVADLAVPVPGVEGT
jgi:endonuclease/exonuclease/phosphatase family metal-dependent hydrolase